jgi:D-alanyl-D-alanine carboxypeptidase/D-alanyl-D-alanine-endopeptidase (penicillin-binding protein 4)
MMKKLLPLSLCLLTGFASAQGLQQKLQIAVNRLQQDSQSRYASISFTVLDAQTGEQIFAANPNMALAPASTLKTITSITAFNLLGKDYTYTTTLACSHSIDANGTLNGDVVIHGSADPTLGSWRYPESTEQAVLSTWVNAIRKAGIKHINGRIVGDNGPFGQSVPNGWIWQDMGSYYGAGPAGLTWRENSFDIKFKASAKVNAPIVVTNTVPNMPYVNIIPDALMGPAGTGDQTYPYFALSSNAINIEGTYAIDQTKRGISAALPDPSYDAAYRLADTLARLGITVSQGASSSRMIMEKGQKQPDDDKVLVNHSSPKLSQIVYWLNQKSINLYAEDILLTMLKQQNIPGQITSINGVKMEQNYWKARGIDPNTLNIVDGSGLSPGDRVTTLTMATILQTAKGQPWFPDFYASLPTHNNNMHMKSGTINNVLCFAGYQTTSLGRDVCFSIMVNNYSGSTSGIRQKIFAVLDELK